MADNVKYLESSWNNRTSSAKEKAIKTIEELKAKKEPVNFNSVYKLSGVSKHFLYGNPEIRMLIEAARSEESQRKTAWHSKYDKTSKSKDVVIESKDKYIEKLEAEITQLRKEVNQLRAMLYETKQYFGYIVPEVRIQCFRGLEPRVHELYIGGGYYEPARGAELSFVECNFGTYETNYWYFNEDAVFTDCYWEEITEYPDVEPEGEYGLDFDSLIPVDGNEVNIADTYYAYMVVNQQSGEAVYYPNITLHLSEDGTGYYETEYEHVDITWSCDTDGTWVLESEMYWYLDLYIEHQDGFDLLWIMMQMGEDIVWFC